MPSTTPPGFFFPKQAVARGYTAVPTSLTTLTTTDTTFAGAYVSNNTAGTLTLLFQDGNGAQPIPTADIEAHQAVFIESTFGSYYANGFKWQASGAGLTCDLLIQTRIGYVAAT